MDLQQDILDAYTDLIGYIGISEEEIRSGAMKALIAGTSKYIRDTKYNLRTLLENDVLTKKESALVALSIAINEKNDLLIKSFTQKARLEEATDAEIGEVYACTSLLGINNVLYRFRHFSANKEYDTMPAKLKMNIMMSPVLGKEFFEILSLSVSAVNGCEVCVASHEQSVRNHGGTQERIFTAIRLSAVVKGLSALLY